MKSMKRAMLSVVFFALSGSGCLSIGKVTGVDVHDNKAEVNVNLGEKLDKIGDTLTTIASQSATPIWDEVRGTFKFSGKWKGQSVRALGGAYDRLHGVSTFWLELGGDKSQGAFTLHDATPSLSAATFATASVDLGPEGFKQKTFARVINNGVGLVSGIDHENSTVKIAGKVVKVPRPYLDGYQDEDDAGGSAFFGGIWFVATGRDIGAVTLTPVDDLSARPKGTDATTPFLSGIVNGFYDPSLQVYFFFTRLGEAFALQESVMQIRPGQDYRVLGAH